MLHLPLVTGLTWTGMTWTCVAINGLMETQRSEHAGFVGCSYTIRHTQEPLDVNLGKKDNVGKVNKK